MPQGKGVLVMKIMKSLVLLSFGLFMAWVMISCVTVELTPVEASGGAPADSAAATVASTAAYPDADYLAAAGSGDTAREAQDDAAAALARIFSARVAVDTNVTEAYRSLISGGTEYTEQELEVVDNIRVSADQELINVKFSDARSDELGQFHVVAYMNRQETGNIYRGLISKNNSRLENYRELSRFSEGTLTAYSYINAAYLIALANEQLLEQLRIINAGMAGALTIQLTSLVDIEAEYRQLQSELRFQVSIEGDTDGQVTAFISAELSRLGFSTDSNGSLAVNGSLSFNTSSTERYETVIWNLILNLIDENDRIIAAVEAMNRDQALDAPTAQALALRTIRETIESELISQLFANLIEVAKIN